MPRRAKAPPPEFPYSVHKTGGWRGQWLRVRRWHSRLPTAAAQDREDFLYAFFQSCASFRDWLIHDRPPTLTQQDIETLVKTYVELRLCQDIANATKHFQLDDPKMHREFSAAREYLPAPVAGGTASSALVILSTGSKYDALALANRCVEIWQTFLILHGLEK